MRLPAASLMTNGSFILSSKGDDGRPWRRARDLETGAAQGYAYTSVLFHRDRVLLTYYVSDDATGRISS